MKSINVLIRLVLIVLVPVLIGISTYRVLKFYFMQPVDPSDTTLKLVEIAPGQTFKKVAKTLEERQIIRTWWSVVVLSRLKKQDTHISAGEYQLSGSMTPKDVLAKLSSGDVFKRKVTVREGSSVWDVGALLEEAGIISKAEFNEGLVDTKLLAKAGIYGESFEGYLFPETYLFSRPIDAQKIIWTMLEEGEKRWSRDASLRADRIGMSRHEILTLASIIEKETGIIDEQPTISSVFHNRLKQGMKLQADPTVIYGISDFNGNLTKKDLETPSPYNTYLNFGLPPGPICNPGEDAINAALYPADTDYLFFVADGSGGHVFSATLKEHNEAVRKYQKSKKSDNS